jgi:hypothetical protein
MELLIEERTVGLSEMTSILDDRFEDNKKILDFSDVIILPALVRSEGDLLNPLTPDIRVILSENNLKVNVAVKEPHKYLGLYDADVILPCLLIVLPHIVPIIHGIIANYIFEHVRHDATVTYEETIIDGEKVSRKKITGPGKEVADMLRSMR